MRIYSIFLIFIALLTSLISQGEEAVPVSYQGRFLPQEAYAQQWLFEIYHQRHLKKDHLIKFHVNSSSPLNFIWKLNWHGHREWDDSPLFWIRSAEVKKILGLPLKIDRFDYNTLHHAIYDDSEISMRIMQSLLIYHYDKAYNDPSNYAGKATLELSQLSPGLWLSLNDRGLVVLESTIHPPWNKLKRETIIGSQIDLRAMAYDRKSLEELQQLISALSLFSQLNGTDLISEIEYFDAMQSLKENGKASKQIANELEQQFPLKARLQRAGTLYKVLPGKLTPGEWYSLHALQIQVYDPSASELKFANNFTLYADDIFLHLRQLYFRLMAQTQKQESNEIEEITAEIQRLLSGSYSAIASTPYMQAAGKQLNYPSINQLAAERLYGNFPFIFVCIGGYAIALLGLSFGLILKKDRFSALGAAALIFSFLLQGVVLLLRSYILGRPPVSNMFETLLYVPWIAVLAGLALWMKYRHTLLMTAAAAVSLALLLLLQITHIDSSFSNVQAVLDSQYWLIVHVLMVVGSYGLFILGGVLGHIYLVGVTWHGREQANMAFLNQMILQTMYLGVALLVPGTLLGGVWAAESWGRFWDWDPKESWAFISICIYLIWIHAYRFHMIGNFGLAIGSIAGLLAIGFTWYGVNYILGTGLHSYGFGQGGENYYYSYLIAEMLFLAVICIMKRKIVAKI